MNPQVAQPEQPAIDMSALIDEWKLSQSYVEQYTRDFPQLDNLVDAVPVNSDPDAPFVGDTTLAGLVRSIPRQSLQQLPVFAASVNGSKNTIPARLCTYFLQKYVFNEDTFGKGLLSTLQIGTEKGLTHGYAPFMAATGSMYNDFGTTLRLLHHRDTSPEPGISDANESGYHYVTANLTQSRVKQILKKAQADPKTSWDVEMLKQVLEGAPRAKEYSQYQSDARKNQSGDASSPTYEFVTRYETGGGGTIITFCPEVTERPLRVLNSYSKWGYPRVLYLVVDPDALTPFGVSRVRLASPNQNLMNIYYGNIASMLLLNSNPPILKRGRFTGPIELKQGVTWETMDPNSSAELKNLDNGSLQFFPQFAQTFAGQIQNIMGGATPQVNPTNGKAGYGKTGPGVKASTDEQDLNTNQITKILENFLRQYALVALDTILSEQEGVDRVIVDDQTKSDINEIAPGTIGDDNKIQVDWQKFYAAIEEWTVEVTVSLSKDELKDKERGDLQDMLVVLAQNAAELGPEAVEKVKDITNLLMEDKAPLVKPLNPNATTAPVAPPPPKINLSGQLDPQALSAAESAASV